MRYSNETIAAIGTQNDAVTSLPGIKQLTSEAAKKYHTQDQEQ